MFDVQFTRPDSTVLTGELGKRLIQWEPYDWYIDITIFLSSMVAHELYKGGEALVELNDLDRQVNWVQKVLKNTEGE